MERVVFPVVGAANVAGEADRRRCAWRLTPEREVLETHSVEANLHVVSRVYATHVADVVRPEPQLDVILAVDRKVMANRCSTARAERQVLALLALLDQVLRDVVGLDDGAAGWRVADSEPADLLGGRHIPFEQGGRERQRRRDVVEAVLVGRVGRDQLGHVDVEVEQVADDIAVLHLVQPVEGFGAARIGRCLSRAVELGLEPPAKPVVGLFVRPWTRLRWHRPDTELPDDLLPDFRVFRDVVDIFGVERDGDLSQLVEHQSGAGIAVDDRLAMTANAVLVDERALW